MSKQTAVEWYRNTFFKALQEGLTTSESEIFEQAKAMEKEQMESIYGKEIIVKEGSHHLIQPFEDYYNETYRDDK